MATRRKPIITESDAVLCSKCARVLGTMESGVLVAGGAIRLWGQARYSCLCGQTYFYAEKLIDEDGESEQSSTVGVPVDCKESVLEILNELGKDYTPAWLEQKKRKAS